MSTLRSKLIKLAHTNTSLRTHLLPLLKKTGSLEGDNPFSLYEGHEEVTHQIMLEILAAASSVREAHDKISKIISRNASLGTRDSESLGAIWEAFRFELKRAMRGNL